MEIPSQSSLLSQRIFLASYRDLLLISSCFRILSLEFTWLLVVTPFQRETNVCLRCGEWWCNHAIVRHWNSWLEHCIQGTCGRCHVAYHHRRQHSNMVEGRIGTEPSTTLFYSASSAISMSGKWSKNYGRVIKCVNQDFSKHKNTVRSRSETSKCLTKLKWITINVHISPICVWDLDMLRPT
jgi:hypothetical protein